MHRAIPRETSSAAARQEPHLEHLPVKVETEEVAAAEPRTLEVIIRTVILENVVVVLGRRGCCMCHVIRALFNGHGVNPAIFEVDEGDEVGVTKVLSEGSYWEEEEEIKKSVLLQLPVVFIGGKAFGGLERVMSVHIKGELVAILKEFGALWL